MAVMTELDLILDERLNRGVELTTFQAKMISKVGYIWIDEKQRLWITFRQVTSP